MQSPDYVSHVKHSTFNQKQQGPNEGLKDVIHWFGKQKVKGGKLEEKKPHELVLTYVKSKGILRTSLTVQRLHNLNTEDPGSIPGQGTKILHTTQHGPKKKKKLKDTNFFTEKKLRHSPFAHSFFHFN